MKQEKLNIKHALLGAVLACTLSLTAHAQNIYRVIDTDGRISYTDAPRSSDKATLINKITGAPVKSTGVNTTSLPAQIRKTYETYPVAIYTTTECTACDTAKSHLKEKGIPYVEYTVNTPHDYTEFKRVAPSSGFPTLKVGTLNLSGYNAQEWDSYLKAAGYAGKIDLPSNYANPAAQPLTDPADFEKDTAKPIVIDISEARKDADKKMQEQNNNPSNIRF